MSNVISNRLGDTVYFTRIPGAKYNITPKPKKRKKKEKSITLLFFNNFTTGFWRINFSLVHSAIMHEYHCGYNFYHQWLSVCVKRRIFVNIYNIILTTVCNRKSQMFSKAVQVFIIQN